jgi:glycosyltransferase involved in cell wall biosynthesis
MSLAQRLEEETLPADLLLCSDYLPVADFLCLAPTRYRDLPVAIYMHENQLTYPVPPGETLDFQFGVTNVVSCMAADRVYFNSHYHREEFLAELPVFLKRFPDYVPRFAVTRIEEASEVLTLGCDLASLDTERERGREWRRQASAPVLLWNHRWEFDKNPEDFFETLFNLKEEGCAFQLIVAGERATKWPEIFDQAGERLKDEILSFGPLPSRAEYAAALWAADAAISTSGHDFFGVSVIEAMYCGCYPLLPNRLSYPEHIPGALHGRHLYLHRENLQTKLRTLLRHGPIEPDPTLAEAAARHDWGRRIDDYDDRLEEVAQSRQSNGDIDP